MLEVCGCGIANNLCYYCTFTGIDIENPSVDVTPQPLSEQGSVRDPKHVISCERVPVLGLSRMEIRSYASSFRVTLAPSPAIPERVLSRIEVCFHR